MAYTTTKKTAAVLVFFINWLMITDFSTASSKPVIFIAGQF